MNMNKTYDLNLNPKPRKPHSCRGSTGKLTNTKQSHHSMMKMYFHGGITETILFESWKTISNSDFIGMCIGIFILGIIYEGIRELRQYFNDENFSQDSMAVIPDTEKEQELERMNAEPAEVIPRIEKKVSISYGTRTLHSTLYAIHSIISYILMLIAMTFNIYLFLAIILGFGVGHLLYKWARLLAIGSNNRSRN